MYRKKNSPVQESTWYCISTDTKHTQRFQHTTQRNLLLSVIKMISGELVLFAAICLFLWQTSRFFFWHIGKLDGHWPAIYTVRILLGFIKASNSATFHSFSDQILCRKKPMTTILLICNKQPVKKGQSNILNKVKKKSHPSFTPESIPCASCTMQLIAKNQYFTGGFSFHIQLIPLSSGFKVIDELHKEIINRKWLTDAWLHV